MSNPVATTESASPLHEVETTIKLAEVYAPLLELVLHSFPESDLEDLVRFHGIPISESPYSKQDLSRDHLVSLILRYRHLLSCEISLSLFSSSTPALG